MSDDISIDYRFSTPICKAKVKGFETRHADLKAFFLEMQKNTDGIQSSNYNGWHSERNLHLINHPLMQWLGRRISLTAIQAIQKLLGEDTEVDIRLREVWANINESGGWNVPHIHPVRWAGVLYVAGESVVPEKDDRKAKLKINEGDTVFINPVSEATFFGQPQNAPYSAEPGHLLLFPGYLLHMVVPHNTDEPRITIAFNIDMVNRNAKQKPSPIAPEHARPKVKVMV